MVTSGLRRACETGELLFASSTLNRHTDARFNEIDYGLFEGCPWTEYGVWLRRWGPDKRPAGASESWNEAMGRVLDGLDAVFDLHSPRVIIGHGFWVSALWRVHGGSAWANAADIGSVDHLVPLTLDDTDLARAIDQLRVLVNGPRHPSIRPRKVW